MAHQAAAAEQRAQRPQPLRLRRFVEWAGDWATGLPRVTRSAASRCCASRGLRAVRVLLVGTELRERGVVLPASSSAAGVATSSSAAGVATAREAAGATRSARAAVRADCAAGAANAEGVAGVMAVGAHPFSRHAAAIDRASEDSRRAGTAWCSSSFWLRSVHDRRRTRSPTTSCTERSSGFSRPGGGQPWPQAGGP